LRAFAAAPAAGPLTIAYEGALFGWHGVRVLLAAFAAAVRQGVDARLLLIGSGPEEAALTAQAAALGVSDCVTFTGHVGLAQLADYLAAADMGVSPYCGRAEFSGLKLLDYKAAGLAIIASGQDGQPAILEHGRTAWIVPPCDEAALSAAIVRLSQDAALRRALGQAARREAEARHSWRHTAEQISRLLARQ
ncbi:MAG: glycosyltransferase family 4 protein, partial [Anaerolineales bacterium]|nr:glycosyltransferase family 4 protein [Anaerolineales bacterium]